VNYFGSVGPAEAIAFESKRGIPEMKSKLFGIFLALVGQDCPRGERGL
jgi:hypothetical protein